MTDDKFATSIVRDGYDIVADRYTEWANGELSPGRVHTLALIDQLLPTGARVLDLGCGSGLPMTASLARRYSVHGVDISTKQLDHARRNVPTATFEQADLLEFDPPAGSFNAVVAFYSLTHIPRDALGPLLQRAIRWLRPGGLLLASFGVNDDPDTVEDDWLGAPMYFSHFDAAKNLELVASAGFDLISATVVADPEDAGPVDFLWVAARRAA